MPPSVGACQEMVAEASPRVAVTEVGAVGVVAGTTGVDAVEGSLVPTELVAVTLKV